MRTEEEIRKQIELVKEEIKAIKYEPPLSEWNQMSGLGYTKALKWVLGEE